MPIPNEVARMNGTCKSLRDAGHTVKRKTPMKAHVYNSQTYSTMYFLKIVNRNIVVEQGGYKKFGLPEIKKLREQHSELQFCFCGDDYEEALQSLHRFL